jgi:uncharacterized protein (DUF433 family)
MAMIAGIRKVRSKMLASVNEPLPLRTDKDGVIRVGNTRVTMDTIVSVFRAGATPEEIILQFPTLNLADVYSVISYYLRNQKEVDLYLIQRQHISDQAKKQNRMKFASENIRERLSARQKKDA